MDREEATRALEVLRKVVGQARDDTAMQNWGLVWIVQGFVNGAAFAATNALLDRGVERPWEFATMWAVAIGLDVGIVLAFRRDRAGVRSFIEGQLWSIWTAFIAAVSLLAVLNHLMGLRTFFLGPVIGVLAAVAFATMGSIVGRRWYGAAAVFCATAIAMAMWSAQQFYILGAVWGGAQIVTGWQLDRDRRRRADAPRIV